MADHGFEQLEHTADLMIRVWAPDLRGLIEQAARGLIDLLVDGCAEPERQIELSAEGNDAEEALIDCLREILLLRELEGLLPLTAEVIKAGERSARCRVGVLPLGDATHLQGDEIKAVTYHDLEIRREEGRLVVEVVFDV